ncbi:MAG: helix-turn-helix transcriptional regulator [Spirochaetales bacterium]|nr:helix-turn-helix transcriptional regulator [Spirochaetales bacterium]
MISGISKKVLQHRNKIVFVIITICALFLLTYSMIELSHLTISIFPSANMQNRIAALTDSIWEGNSKVEEFFFNENELTLKYILKEGVQSQSPLVFVTMILGTVENPLDISDFESISITIKEATNKSTILFIKTYLPGISLPEAQNAHTLRHNQYILGLNPEDHYYNIKLKDFITPPWWTAMMKVNEALLPHETYKQVITFDMQFNQACSGFVLNKPEHIVIENISLHKTFSTLHIILIGIILFYYAGCVIVLIRRKLKSRGMKLPRQKSLELESYRNKELELIKNYIESNYNNPEISTRMVYDALGIPPAKVFDILKQEYHLTFKQLINTMRIQEATRLLEETDLRISEIVFNLGFNNISYFNTLFKSEKGETPSEYRKKKNDIK